MKKLSVFFAALRFFPAVFLLVFSIEAQAVCSGPAGVAGDILYNADQHIM